MSPAENVSEAPAGVSLPITAVTLFASGVAHIVREGEAVAGETNLTLNVRTAQVNDLLKSLALFDPNGVAQAVTYPSRDPIGRALQSFAVDVTNNIGRGDLLKKMRGAEASLQTVSGETVTGRIVGVEDREETIEVNGIGRILTTETLILLTDEGLTAVPLEKIRLLRLLEERLNREFREALILLASGSDNDRRALSLRFSGDAARQVRAAYIVEAPVWKVTYRLALEEGEKPYLQGWAIIENVTDEDWNQVEMALVSGRPVSFVQDLYQPLYIHRPVVALDVVASPYPQVHEGSLDLPMLSAMLSESPESGTMDWMAEDSPRAVSAPPSRGLSRSMSVAAAPTAPKAYMSRDSAPAQASGRSAGELFEYRIASPVTLPRQQAAMIPIVSGDWGGEKLSLYNADNDPRFPLNAVRLKNDSDLHLKGGPVTIFDDGAYAGDARLTDLPPGDERLLTYAVDLAVEAERQETVSTGKTTLSIKNGVLHLRRSQRRKTAFTLKSKAKSSRMVLVEHPFFADWTLVEPEAPAERTANRYRFAVPLAPGERKTLTVLTERPTEETVALLNGNLDALVAHASSGAADPKLRDALRSIAERRNALRSIAERETELTHERTEIHREQERLRGNMGSLDRDSALYRRYVGELDKQETRLTEISAEEDRLRAERQRRKDDLQNYINALEMS